MTEPWDRQPCGDELSLDLRRQAWQETVRENLSFRRLVRAESDGRVTVTLQAMLGRKLVGKVSQGRRKWRWQAGEGARRQEGWTETAEEGKEEVRRVLSVR